MKVTVLSSVLSVDSPQIIDLERTGDRLTGQVLDIL